MPILKINAGKDGNILPHLEVMKIIGPLVFSALMMININSYAQTDKNANYGGVKDSLNTYLADCFVKEIMLKNSPARIRNVLAYIVSTKMAGNDATDYLVGELILKKEADDIQCGNQSLETGVVQSNIPLTGDTTASGKQETVVKEEKKSEVIVTDNKKSETVVKEDEKSEALLKEEKKEENTEKRREEIREERRKEEQKKEAVAKDNRKSDQGLGEALYECDLPYQTAENYGWCRVTDSYELAKLAVKHGYLPATEEYTGSADQNICIQRAIIGKNLRKK